MSWFLSTLQRWSLRIFLLLNHYNIMDLRIFKMFQSAVVILIYQIVTVFANGAFFKLAIESFLHIPGSLWQFLCSVLWWDVTGSWPHICHFSEESDSSRKEVVLTDQDVGIKSAHYYGGGPRFQTFLGNRARNILFCRCFKVRYIMTSNSYFWFKFRTTRFLTQPHVPKSCFP